MQKQLETYFLSSSRFYQRFGEPFIYNLLEFFTNQGTNYSELCYSTHTDVSNPFPGRVFVSLINWYILINRTVFHCKCKNVWDVQSFNIRNLHYFDIISCNILQNGRTYLPVYLCWWCPEWNHSWSAQQEEDICLLRWSVPCKLLTWLFIWAPYVSFRECLPSLLPFNNDYMNLLLFMYCVNS